MTKDEALKLALEALERYQVKRQDFERFADVITAIKEALAQPEQEPFEYWNAVEGWVKVDEVREHFDSVGCGTIYKTAGEGREPLYTTPPQRQPLTDEEMFETIRPLYSSDEAARLTVKHSKDEYRAIEAAHGIKENT